jgi:hypothetical protein
VRAYDPAPHHGHAAGEVDFVRRVTRQLSAANTVEKDRRWDIASSRTGKPLR